MAIALLVGFAALLWLHRDALPLYGAHLTGNLPAVTLRPNQLANNMDEAALRRHFGSLSWTCTSEPRNAAARNCVAAVSSTDDVAALSLTARLANGRLQSAELLLPWWAHHTMLRKLVATLGAPAHVDRQAPVPAVRRQVGWRVDGGMVLLDRDPGWDPLRPSALTWVPASVTGARAPAAR
jgi:hypothetical protein